MAQKPLSECTVEELNKRRSTIKGLLLALGLIWMLVLVLNIYLLIFQETSFQLLAVLSALFPVMIPLLISLKKLKEAIRLRGS